jgi:enterochelin esterase-like enzyme/DUF1680 family protein
MKKLLVKLHFLLLPILINAQTAQVSSGKIIHYDKFKSNFVDARNVDVWLPDGYSPKKKYAVLYMHDGRVLFDIVVNTMSNGEWRVDETLGMLIKEKKVRNCIVVGIWNNNEKRFAEYFPQKIMDSIPEPTRSIIQSKQLGTTAQADNYLKFIVTELKPYIDKTYSVKKDVKNTFIMGSSMGGLVSLYALCEYPEIFGGAACLSTHTPMAAFELINDKTDEEVASKFRNYLKLHLPKANTRMIYFDYGNKTGDSLYKPFQEKIDLILKTNGYTNEFWQTKFFEGENHSEQSWAKRLEIPLTFLLSTQTAKITMQKEKLQSFPFGSIKPTSWLKTQMEKDVDGFVGNLDLLVPDLINDPIYGSGRLHKNSQVKDLGNLKEGDAEGSEQYKWWNSETQSNWWDGYIRNVFLLNNKAGIEKVNEYVKGILATQDEDGYLGIYDKELRYNFNSENGELWSKATLYRGLLAYYEVTKDEKVWQALVRAVDNVMVNYPINTSSPFSSGEKFNGGVSHGLTFTDVLDKMYQITEDKKYTEYALFLYTDFSKTYQSEEDVQLPNILKPKYKLKSHGVHTYEHLRPLIVAAYQNKELQKALTIYLERIKKTTTLTGGPIGDEWIAERKADATHTGYEYCSIQELLDSYTVLLQKTGNASIGDEIETIFYNAAQGARNPDHSCIAYLKTDNSYEMLGTKNGEIEPNRKQTRYKYSPAHQDVAVCCNPNAGRISPYFIQSSWMKENESTLVATLLMPNVLETTIKSSKITIENQTNYPNENTFHIHIQLEKATVFTLKIRKPNWATSIVTNEKYSVNDNYIIIERTFDKTDTINLEFKTEIRVQTDLNGSHYFTYGSLFYAKSINSKEFATKEYATGFIDLSYEPLEKTRFEYIENHQATYENKSIKVNLKNSNSDKIEVLTLTPFGRTILRQVSF